MARRRNRRPHYKRPTLAPALVRLQREIDTRWPNRRKHPAYLAALDAWLGDPAHASRSSGHNPDPRNLVHALDVCAAGINARHLLGRVIGDPRVWYVIHDGNMWSATRGWERQDYKGPNPHRDHVHISILSSGGAGAEETGGPMIHVRARQAEQNTTGYGLASLIHPRMWIKYRPRVRGWRDGRRFR